MIKVALASDSESQAREVIDYLSANYDINDREDSIKYEQFVSVVTLSNSTNEEIKKMLFLIRLITGYDPLSKRKKREIMKAKNAAAYILRNRFGLSFAQCGRMLNCNHTTVLMRLRKINNNIEVKKPSPIELAVRMILESL